MDYPKRKKNRLPDFEYGVGAYCFITVCTKGRARILGRVVGAAGPPEGAGAGPAKTVLTAVGRVVENDLLSIGNHYPGVKVETYVIMPAAIRRKRRGSPFRV